LPVPSRNAFCASVDRIREEKVPETEQALMCLADTNVSRRHCAIVNFLDDVWLFDFGSTQGVFVDGTRIDRKVYLEGVHQVSLGH
jgi:pSer/pThr/pTyr-binding forkhead associated (FHA) protein